MTVQWSKSNSFKELGFQMWLYPQNKKEMIMKVRWGGMTTKEITGFQESISSVTVLSNVATTNHMCLFKFK